MIFVSRTLTYEVLAKRQVTTSSQKFERGFAIACAAKTELTVINVGRYRSDQPVMPSFAGVRFHHAGYLKLVGAIREASEGRRAVVLTTGYDPRLMCILLLCRLLGFRTYTFIYDTHKLASRNRQFLRRAAIDAFFGVGFFIARFVNGWIVLNDGFIKKRRIGTSYLKSRVGINLDQDIPVLPPANEEARAVFLFSGTLNADNGVDVLLRAVALMPEKDFELHIFGYGPMTSHVEEAARSDPRICYFGRVANDEVVNRQQSADYLVHLRDPISIAIDYSYPSKLIEYLCSGRPVLSNLFPGIGDVAHYVVEIEAFSPTAVARALSSVLNRSMLVPDSNRTTQLLMETHGWTAVVAEIWRFVTDKSVAIRDSAETG